MSGIVEHAGRRTPDMVFALGVLGLVPFLAPAVVGLVWPALAAAAAGVVAIYGALILSFLGGARWAFEVARSAPDRVIVALAMLPTLAGFALLLVPEAWRVPQLVGLAALLALHWAWDRGARGLPGWYPRLRGLLTVGAVAGLLAMAVVAY